MEPRVGVLEQFFLQAMAAGYAQNVPPTTIQDLPGSKVITFRKGSFRLTDLWLVIPNSNKSSGITTIYHKDSPVWIMHYGGWYDDRAIPFLKTCLNRAYVERKDFCGGRGPRFFEQEPFVYENRIEKNGFTCFSGEEQIIDVAKVKQLGFHWYRGGRLI